MTTGFQTETRDYVVIPPVFVGDCLVLKDTVFCSESQPGEIEIHYYGETRLWCNLIYLHTRGWFVCPSNRSWKRDYYPKYFLVLRGFLTFRTTDRHSLYVRIVVHQRTDESGVGVVCGPIVLGTEFRLGSTGRLIPFSPVHISSTRV